MVLVQVLVNPVRSTSEVEDIDAKREPAFPARPPCWMARCTRRRRQGYVKKRNEIKVMKGTRLCLMIAGYWKLWNGIERGAIVMTKV